jgi:hypothetical protein
MTALGAAVVWQFVVGLFFLLRAGKESLAFSSAASAVVLSLGMTVCWKPETLALLRRTIFGKVTLVFALGWLAWLLVALATIVTFRARGWDESCYLLSGLALRGQSTPYMADRPPVTHFLAALFADAPQFLNAFLVAALVGLLSIWGIRRWGWSLGALPLLLLATQNAFLEPLFEILSELPAAILLILGFFLLARERFFLAGAVFAICGLARWNLAVVPVAVAVVIPWRLGWRAFARYATGGLLVASIFLIASFLFVEHPLRRIIEGNLIPAHAWAAENTVKPDLLSRSHFYITNAFFLTPLAAFAVLVHLTTPAFRTASTTEDWVIRTAMPVAILSYGMAMMNVGGLFGRFMAPIIPLGMIVFTEFVWQACVLFDLSQIYKRVGVAVVSAMTMASGIWPASVLLHARNRASLSPLFSTGFQQRVMEATPKSEVIYAPPILPISESNAYPAMFALRRTLKIPNARRDSTGGILAEQDAQTASTELMQNLPDGAVVLLPGQGWQAVPGTILAEDAGWSLIRLSK